MEQDQPISIWKKLFILSYRIIGIGTLLGAIAQFWKGREFTSDDGLNFILIPFTVIYLTAFAYLTGYLIQTATSKKLRYFFIYPVFGFLILLFSLIAIAN